MNFDVDRQHSHLAPIVLVEIDIPCVMTELVNYEAGIWSTILTPGTITVTDDHDVTGYYSNTNELEYTIQSARIGDVFFTRVASLSSLRLQNESFLYDEDTTRIYFHFDDWSYPPNISTIFIGNTEGYCNKVDYTRAERSYYNDIYYDPRVVSVPALSKQKEPLHYGVMSFEGGTITLNNGDGNFDSFAIRNLFGQPVRVWLGFEGYDYDDFKKIFVGFIDDFNYGYSDFKINVKDNRQLYRMKLPVYRLDGEEHLELADKNVDKYLPIAYGAVRNAATFCMNELDAVGPYDFYFMDTENHTAVSIDTVYANGVEVTPAAVDLDAGYFTLLSVDCKDGESLMEITVDFHGAGTTKGIDVIRDLFNLYTEAAYIDENFNRIEIAIAETGDRDVGLYIGERTDLIDIIEDIAFSIDAVFFQMDDGRVTMRRFDEDREPIRVIQSDEWLGEPEIEYDRESYLTSIEIKYSKDQTKNEYLSAINDDYKTETFRKYKNYQEKSLETILTTRSDALLKSEAVMDRSREMYQIVTRKTKMQNIDLELMDFIVADHSRIGGGLGWKVYEITGYTKNIDAGEIELKLIEVCDTTFPEYYYTQGDLFMSYIYGHHIFSKTFGFSVTGD